MANIFSTIASWFQRQRTQFNGTAIPFGTTEVYPKIDQTKAITQGFNSNTAVYSIIKKDAKKFGTIKREVEVEVESEDDSNPEPEYTGPLSDLIKRPNPEQGQDAFFTLVRAFYKTCGEAFVWLNRGNTDSLVNDKLVPLSDEAHAKKPVLEMYVLPSNKMIVVPDPDNIYGVYGYILESGIRIPIRKVDIIHWKDVNLDFDVVTRNQLRGFSPLQAGYKTLEANNSATDVTVRMNQNSGVKGVMTNKSLAQMNAVQETQQRKIFDEKINNIDVKGAVSALQGDWSYHNLGLTSVDLDVLKGKDYSMKELCFLLGMPFELFDAQTTFNNKEMAQKGWVINEIMPDCKQFDNELNRVLLPAFGLEGKVEICSDFDELPELQEDKKAQIEWLMKGPFSPNEIREAVGYEPSDAEGADEIFIPSGFMPLSDLTGDGGQQIMQDLYGAGQKVIKPTNGQMNGVKPKPVAK